MKDKECIDLAVLLPHVQDQQDSCIGRLEEMLQAKQGVSHVQITQVSDSVATSQFCIHFDRQQVSLSELQEYARRAGLLIENKYGHFLDRTPPMDARLAMLRGEKLSDLTGVLEAVVAADGTVRIEYDKNLVTDDELREQVAAIQSHAFSSHSDVTPHAGHRHTGHAGGHQHGAVGCCDRHRHTTASGLDIELVCAVLAGACVLVGWLISFSASVPSAISIALYITAYLLAGGFMLREAVERLWVGKFEIDSLMLLAAAGAAYLGKWAEGALLLFLFSIGHALESYAMGRAKRAIEALTQLAPATAHVRRSGQWVDVAVEDLQVGEVVSVKPNERISADGFVVQGTSSVNQAPVTGESVPVDKHPVDDVQQASEHPEKVSAEHRVYAGTINGTRALEIQVTRAAADNTLSRIVKLVSEAETRVSPTQTLTSHIEKYFVPAVLAFDVLLLFAWLIIDETFSTSLYRAMSVLVAASPCALAISTPSAVLSGIARAARGGVLIKGGGPLESLGSVNVIAFDKTGTLTEGKPRLTDVLPLPGITREKLLSVAVAVETLSDHPLASAIVRDAQAQLGNAFIPNAQSLEGVIGRGVRAQVDGQPVAIGKESLFTDQSAELPPEIRQRVDHLKVEGRTTMIVRQGDQYLGVLGVMDTPRSSAAGVVSVLKQLGIQRMLMLSGDHQQVAQAVARSVGIEEAHGDLMPDDKVRIIQSLSTQGGVAMVGDGVNDAPAMAGASVGIAMGAAGSHVALETADVALMADDLNHLPFAVGLSRQTRAIIRQNLWISLGMVAFLVPATTLGLSLGPAVVLHEGSTLVVVANALRLLIYKSPLHA